MIEYSLVIPVYNEAESLPSLLGEIKEVMDSLGESYEVILVDDYSADSSLLIMEEYQKQFPRQVQVIHLPLRSGQTFALRKGMDAADGNFVITMDADLQNDPTDIPKLVAKMKEGYDVVCGWRKSRRDKWLKSVLSKFGNILQRLFTGMKIHDVSCTLRLFKKECAQRVALNWEGQHRFIPLSLSLQGYKIGEIVSNHRQRQFGMTKYTHKRVFKVAVDFFRVLATRGRT